MWTILRYSFWRSKAQILGWGISLAILGGYMLAFYDTLAEQRTVLEQLIKNYPPELMAFFGGVTDLFSPAGYLHIEFFSYMPIIVGIYAVLAGSGLLASDEESGTLDLILAYPVSRTALFLGRLIAFMLTLVAILLLTWLGFLVGMQSTTMGLTAGEMALPFLSMFSILFLFGALALLLSMLAPSRNMAAMLSGLVLVASYFITSWENIDPGLKDITRFSPLNYYQGGRAIDGLNLEWFWGLIGISLLFALLAWWRFERRDIRVGGEGGWRLEDLLPRQWRRLPAETGD